ncbi:hypothetical protein GYMLUDRAFT_77917 [Collybiopsis luxurians FD-317 M1]|uniref:Uncharacterized protein n=1 Tax=Collybiopsis luxurians FD-317 M1 TaxID=944289 RepID=A0A0D0BCI1_9AGAR|nr:hypothetical protein GYMLUDRAFT_77917 [Collybiopsis luxurians FD-317 M1]
MPRSGPVNSLFDRRDEDSTVQTVLEMCASHALVSQGLSCSGRNRIELSNEQLGMLATVNAVECVCTLSLYGGSCLPVLRYSV